MRGHPSVSLTLAVVFATNVAAQNDTPKSVTFDLATAAAARVKSAYFAMDYVGGVREAQGKCAHQVSRSIRRSDRVVLRAGARRGARAESALGLAVSRR